MALQEDNAESLKKIIDYVSWAAAQDSDDLASVVDLAFFLPVFRDASLSSQLREHFSPQLFSDKWLLLMEQPG